jgi:hypothetical protein
VLRGTRFGAILEERGGLFGYQLGKGSSQSIYGKNRTATAVGGPTLTYGRYGQGATLNGTSQCYTMGSFTMMTGVSFGVRFKHTSTTASMTLVDFPQSVSGGTLIYMRANEGGTGKVNIAGTAPFFNAASSSSTFNDGLWHAAVGVYAGGNMTLYVDGIQQAQAAAAIPAFLSDFPRAGSERWFGADYSWYNGSLADPFAVQTVLTAKEIRLYYSDMGLYGGENDTTSIPFASAAKPWLFSRSTHGISRPHLQVA